MQRHNRLVGAPINVFLAHLRQQPGARKHLTHRRLQAAETHLRATMPLGFYNLLQCLNAHCIYQRHPAHANDQRAPITRVLKCFQHGIHAAKKERPSQVVNMHRRVGGEQAIADLAQARWIHWLAGNAHAACRLAQVD